MESSKNKKTGRVLGLVIDKSRARLVWSNADAPFLEYMYMVKIQLLPRRLIIKQQQELSIQFNKAVSTAGAPAIPGWFIK